MLAEITDCTVSVNDKQGQQNEMRLVAIREPLDSSAERYALDSAKPDVDEYLFLNGGKLTTIDEIKALLADTLISGRITIFWPLKMRSNV